MSLFKKPKRNFRARQTHNSESGDEHQDATRGDDEEEKDNSMSVFQAVSNMRKTQAMKKKKSRTTGDSTIPKSKSTLSFGEEINEVDSFKVKKSSRSKQRAKLLKKESRREKEEEEKRETFHHEFTSAPVVSSKNGSAEPEDMDMSDGSDKRDRSPSSESSRDSEEEKIEERKKRLAFDRVLKAGAIPDAHMIHMARKRRQQARELGDFVPLEEQEKPHDSGSRLIREEDHDHSDDDDEPISFTVNTREKELRRMQESIITAQEERSNSEDSDHEREWEEQQIRKGVSIPQVAPTSGTEMPGNNGNSFDQYLYTQSSNIFNPNAPEYVPSAPPAPSTNTQQKLTNLPISLDIIKRSLKDRLDSLQSVHRAHRNEREDIVSRLESCESSITKCKDSQGGLEDQYKFFQEMRGYVRDLVECLNEKVPSINYLERSMNHQLRTRAEDLVSRRQDDLKDQSEDAKLAFQNKMPAMQMDQEKQRRVAEREARRARRRRAREARGIKNHHEGMSTDDEENKASMSKFKMATEQIEHDCRTMFSDVTEEFHRTDLIKQRFEEWKMDYKETYDQAYIGLCLPKLFTPFVRLELITWNPIEDQYCMDFEEMPWYEALMFFGYREGEDPDPKDSDTKIIPSLIEKVLLPKLTDQVDRVWDPLSSHQTLNLAAITKRLIRDYPSITAESKNTQELLRTIVRRLRKTLSDDVFIPLCSKQMMESKSSPTCIFAQRQFWTCIKLLSNLMVWQGMLSDKVVKELTLDSLVNRYLLLALQTTLNTSTADEVLYKSQAVVACLPKAWFADLVNDSTLPQLAMLCRFLNSFADSIGQKAIAGSDEERREAREMLKQITKMLVTIHAMDHAVALSEKFSFKM